MRPRPLFERNEEVLDIEGEVELKATITGMEYRDGTGIVTCMDGRRGLEESGWWYSLDGSEWLTHEMHLRKLPPEATDEDFEKFMDRLNLPNLVPETV